MIHRFLRTAGVRTPGVFLAASLVLAGCESDGGRSKARLAPSEFALLTTDAAIEPDPSTIPPPGEVTGPISASEGILDVKAIPGPPPVARVEAAPVEGASLVEATVGSINGKPIYASAFLDDLGASLSAQARELAARPRGRELWRQAAAAEIRGKLDRTIEDELLRAEAMGNLAPEQRQGFFAFMQSLQREELSKSGGSMEAARRRVAETESLSLDQYLRQREQQALIRSELQRKVRRGVNVTWRDIKLEYDRTWANWNPDPLAVFRMVQIPNSAAEDLQEFQTRLSAGEPFATLAALPLNRNDSAKGGVRSVRFTGPQAEANFFANADLNTAARTLAPGQTAGPIALGPISAWLHLDRIEQTSIGLYEAQRKISDDLFEAQVREEVMRYIGRLRERANMTSVEEMVARLLVVAEERYYPSAR
jgi:hypothetical protein